VDEHASSRYEYLPLAVNDALSQSFERDDALWSDNAYSDAVLRGLYYKGCAMTKACVFHITRGEGTKRRW
jgi:hypothetical protein